MPEVRLIDANTLHAKILEENRRNYAATENVAQILLRIETAPTIEPEERHGRWIECDYKHIEHGFIETEHNAGLCCSNCRAAFQKRKMTYKQYCAACGARKDGG